jgi:hypothetical protein
MDKRSKTAREARLGRIVRAIDERMANVDSMMMHGKKYTRAELRSLFQEELAAMANTRRATAARRAAVKEERRITARNKAVLQAFESYLVNQLGAESQELTLFTFTPRRKGKKTSEVKAKAVQKGKTTRQRLGTLGPKQRKRKIKSFKGQG